MGAVRLEISLSNQSEWLKMFDPRDWTMTVPTDRSVENNAQIRIDLDVGGWLVTLRGTVVGRPTGAVTIALGGTERDKINYLNGFVRGGLLNLREKRRLPIRLPVTYGAVEGPASTFTKDLNAEGVFLFTDKPLPETSQVHMLLAIPGKPQPLSLMGRVTHTILVDDKEPAGMGIVFELDEAQRADLQAIVRELEEGLLAGRLPTNVLE